MEIRTKLITDLPLSEVLGGSEIFPVNQFGVAKKASTQDIIEFTKKQEYATWVNQASTNLKTIDLSTRYLNLYNVPLNQEPFPEFFIGEAGFFSFQGEVSSLSGFKYHYNDQTDRFVFVSYSSAVSANVTNLTAYYIDSNAFMYITNLSTSNTLSARNIYVTDQITISANSNNDALFIVQNGQGNAIEVFDQSNDTTPFVVTASGNVGIKTPNPLVDLTIFGNVSSSATLSGRNVHVMERLGVATARPNETLTVLGNISASGVIFDRRLNSDRWFETFTNYSAGSANEAQVATFVNANSANIRNVNTKVNTTSANWDSVYSHMQANTGSIYAARTYVGNNSANFSDSVSRYNNLSATYAPFSYVNAGFLPLSGGEVSSGTVRISGLTTFGGDVAIVGRLSANLLTVLKTESIPITASTLNVDGSGRFGGPFQLDGQVRVNNNLTVTGFANVSSTITADGIVTSRTYLRDLNGDSRDWNSAYVRWNAVSALDLQVRNFVNPNSANIRNVNTKVNSTSSNWDQVYSAVIPSSANWNSNYSHWNSNSGLIFMTRNFVTSNSANSLNVNTKVNSTSSNWDRTYSTWSPISAITTGTTTFVSQTSSLTNRVNTYVAGTSASFILNGGNTGATTIGTNNNTNLTLETNGTAKVTITGTGNVGINQTSPTSRLHVVDSSANPAVLITQGSSGDGLRITQTGTGNALVVEDQASDTTPFIIKADGKVGIGTSTPTHSLQVNNAISFTGGDIPLLINYLEKTFIIATSAANWGTSIRLTNSDDIDAFRDSIHFYTSGTSRMYLRSDGNVGIGTTGPTQKLDVAGNIKSSGIIYDATGNSTNWNSAYSSFFNLSAAIGEGLTEFQESSARYNRVSTRVEGTSANWNSVYTTFQANSGKYNSERGVVNIPLSGTTLITVPNHTVGFMDIYLNGIKLVKPDDFSETTTTITLTEPTKYNNYKLEYVVYGAYNVANAVSRTGDTMTGNLTVPTLNVTGSFTLPTIVLSRNNTGIEGGEIQLARASDNLSKYYIDVNGSGSDPNLRFFERVGASTFTERVILQGATGNLGIGMTNPTAKAYIYQNHATQVAAAIQTNAGIAGDALWISNAGNGSGIKIINSGTGSPFIIEDTNNLKTTPFMVDSAGRVLLGATSSPSSNVSLYIESDVQTGGPNGNILIRRFNSTFQTSTNVTLGKAYGSSSAPQATVLNDYLGAYSMQGMDTSLTFRNAAVIRAEVDGNPTSTAVPARLVFQTSDSSGVSEKVRITSTGNVGIGTTNPNEKLTIVGNVSATGMFYGDGAGLKSIDLTRKFLSWPIKDNYVGNPLVFRLNGFMSTDKKIYIAGYAYNYSTTFGQNEANRAYAYPGFQAMHIYGNDSAIPTNETVERFWMGSRYMFCQTNNDRVYGIGINHRGQLGVGNNNQIFMWTLVANLPNISKISLYNGTQNTYFDNSYLHTLFVTSDNRLYATGYGNYGQLGLGGTANFNSPQIVNVGAIQNKSIAECYVVGDDHNAYGSSFCIDTNRNLYFTGYQAMGHGGLGDTVQRNSFVQVPSIKADKISCVGYNGEATTFVLDKQLGRLYGAGVNTSKQLGYVGVNRSSFAAIPGLESGVVDFVSGTVRNGAAIAIMSDGSVRTWGRNSNGLLGHNGTTDTATPTIPTNLANRVFLKARIVSGYRTGEWPTSYLLDNQGDIWSSGYNGYGQRGYGTTADNVLYTRMRKPSNVYFIDFETWGFNSGTGITALDSEGQLWSCGYHNEHSGGLVLAAQAMPVFQRCTIF